MPKPESSDLRRANWFEHEKDTTKTIKTEVIKSSDDEQRSNFGRVLDNLPKTHEGQPEHVVKRNRQRDNFGRSGSRFPSDTESLSAHPTRYGLTFKTQDRL